MDHMVGLAILAEGGVQHGGRQLHPARETARLMQRREGVTIVSNSAFDFFRRIFSRVADYITRIRRYFIFTLAKDGKLVVKEEKREIKVEATTSGACEPLLTEIVVSFTEAVTEPKTAEFRDDEACGSNSLDEPTLRFENACQIESASNNLLESASNNLLESASNNLLESASNNLLESASYDLLGSGSNEVLEGASIDLLTSNDLLEGASIDLLEGASIDLLEGASIDLLTSNDLLESASPGESDSHLQEPANPTTCEPDMIIPLELNRHSQEREEEFPMCTKDAPSCDMKLETPVGDKSTRMSISQLNAIMVEQVTKYLQALERSMTPFAEASMEHKATHWRAIILATLVAVAVWARNAKHLHESMPRIRGSSINVHIRSRL